MKKNNIGWIILSLMIAVPLLTLIFANIKTELNTATKVAGRERVMPQFEIQNAVLSFFLFDTLEEMREELGPDYENTVGLSECEWNPAQHISYCFIWAVRPKFVDDEESCTLGHEVMHAIYGTYHTDEYAYRYGTGCTNVRLD